MAQVVMALRQDQVRSNKTRQSCSHSVGLVLRLESRMTLTVTSSLSAYIVMALVVMVQVVMAQVVMAQVAMAK